MATLIDENIEEKTTAEPAAAGTGRTIAVSLSTMITAAVVAALVITAGVFAALWISARGELSDSTAATAANQHAEQVATDYAVGAATIDYKDVNSWFAKLKANTTPTLANKFDATAPKLQEILVPLKWTSTATPIAAKVASDSGGIYKVNVFVNVNSTSAQAPDGGLTTVTYSVTIDTNSGWKISDVGGMDGALPRK
ncbi:hypothetical protein [Nocardia sp. NPDC056000]|uniref:hypothetical protein n=1 Tax=Nocardia sp. NPDC056000 TaxID=3345674 RepID=UPI0035E0CFB4